LLDFLGDLVDNDSQLDEATVVGTTMSLLVTGTTTTSNSLTYVAYELAKSPDVQEKLRKELQDHMANENDIINNEKLQKLDYLDMVISETLRRHPPVPIVSRSCTKDYFFEEGNYTFKENEEVLLPFGVVMMDGRYYTIEICLLHCKLTTHFQVF